MGAPARLWVGLRARGLWHREGPARLLRKRDKQQGPTSGRQSLAGVHRGTRDMVLSGCTGTRDGGGTGHPGPASRKGQAANEETQTFIFCIKNKLPPSSIPPPPNPPQGQRRARHRAASRSRGGDVPADPSAAMGRVWCTAAASPAPGVLPAAPSPRRWGRARGDAQGGRGWGQCRAASRTRRSSRGVHGRA